MNKDVINEILGAAPNQYTFNFITQDIVARWKDIIFKYNLVPTPLKPIAVAAVNLKGNVAGLITVNRWVPCNSFIKINTFGGQEESARTLRNMVDVFDLNIVYISLFGVLLHEYGHAHSACYQSNKRCKKEKYAHKFALQRLESILGVHLSYKVFSTGLAGYCQALHRGFEILNKKGII